MSLPWTDTFFDEVYARWSLATRPPATLAASADFIERVLELRQPARIFDQCCGIGKLASMLARRGHHVFGIDRNPRYVAAARYLAQRDALSATFVAADAGEVQAPAPCDAALSWYTSFGYAADRAADRRWIERLHASLTPVGGLVLDVGNRARVDASFAPRLTVTLQSSDGEARLTRDCDFDARSGVMRQRWRFELPGGVIHERSSVVRIYGRDELAALLTDCGFGGLRWFGSVWGEPLHDGSERCIVVARRMS